MKIDINSADWKLVEEFANSEIAKLHIANEGDLDGEETAKIRGQILFAKKILALGAPPEQKVEIPKTEYIS